MIVLTILAWLVFVVLLVIERRQVLLGASFILATGLSLLVLGLHVIGTGQNGALPYIVFGVLGTLILLGIVFGPFLLLGTLVYNSWLLLRREGKRWYNFLSLGLAVALGAYLYAFPRLGDQLQTPTIWYYLYLLVGLWVLYGILLSLSYTLSAFFNFWNPLVKRLDYVVVLGSGLNGEEVTPLLASRIDKGIAIYRKHQGSQLILSGGQGADEVISEAQAMTNYALKQGVPESDIILEHQSTNTEENIRFSVALMTGQRRFAVVTNYYHLFRALLLAKKAGVSCVGYGARTKFYFSLNAFIREFIGYLVMSWKWHAALLAIGTVGYLFLVFAVMKGW